METLAPKLTILASASTEVIMWSMAVLLACLACIPLLLWLRARYRSSGRPSGEPFTMDQLCQMRDTGHLSEHEFKRLRQALLGTLGPKSGPELTSPGEDDDAKKGPGAAQQPQ